MKRTQPLPPPSVRCARVPQKYLLLALIWALTANAQWQFEWSKHPEIKLGKALRVEFTGKFHNDLRDFGPDRDDGNGSYELHRARVGVQGRLFRRIEFELERELSDTDNSWRDAWVNLRLTRGLQVKGGKFKLPFSLDQLTSAGDLSFMYRSRAASFLAPGREVGVMAHGRIFQRRIKYEAGLFRHDGENARAADHQPAGGSVLAARMVATLDPKRDVEVGFSMTTGEMEEGLTGLRARTLARETFFPRINVHGRRLRTGVEAAWTPGPFAVKGEFIQVRDQRAGQGLGGDDLPDLVSRGWYLSGAWRINRENHPRWGWVQAVARVEGLDISSDTATGRLSRSPRAFRVMPASDRVWTIGSNWHLNRFTRLQSNLAHERLSDVLRNPGLLRERSWTRAVRIEFGF